MFKAITKSFEFGNLLAAPLAILALYEGPKHSLIVVT